MHVNNNAKNKGTKDYYVTATAGDIDEIIGGRREEDGQMLQPKVVFKSAYGRVTFVFLGEEGGYSYRA